MVCKKKLTVRKIEFTSTGLHVLAMICMLCDHLWGTIVPGNDWLTCIGRITLPIYAFLIVEGYFHTSNLKGYVKRLLICAVLSEIPFNLVMGGNWFFPFHQNTLWSFLISIGLISWNEHVQKQGKLWKNALVAGVSLLAGSLAGLLTMVDYYHAGILTVMVFYFFRQKKWWSYVMQFLCLWYINGEILGGYIYEFSFAGKQFHLLRQEFALLALIPIWLYRGKQGYKSKWLQYGYYVFYPLHLLILGIL